MSDITVGLGEGFDFGSIQDAIDAAGSGDVVVIAAGTYAGFTLKDGVSVQGAGEGEVTITGAIVAPATLADVTVSGLTVENGGVAGKLLDLSATTTLTEVAFENITFRLTADYSGEGPPIGNLQTPGITLVDGDGDGDDLGLTFSNVTVDGGGYEVAASNSGGALVYTSVKGDGMLLSGVTLTGHTDDQGTVIAQWNMKTDYASPSSVKIVDSHTSEGGNFYVSGFDGVTIADSVFDGQGLALNGVKNAEVTGNVFQNIDDSIVSGGGQSRGLTIEDAWGTNGVSNVTITGNTFLNISAEEGAIAFQRWGTSGEETATIVELNGVEVQGNTFTAVDTPIYFNPGSFGAGAAIPGDFAGSALILGTSGTDDIPIGDDAAVSGVDGVWIVSENGAETALFHVEAVTNTSGTQWLVGNGGFATIQEAIDAAEAGDTILVSAGVYGAFTADVEGLTIVASGEVVIQGALPGNLGIPDGMHLDAYFEANNPAYSDTPGIVIGANGVTLSGFTIQGFSVGLSLGTSSGVTITDNAFVDNVTGIRKGTAAEVTDLTVSDNTFSHGIHGMNIYAAEGGAGMFDAITMNGNHFSHMSEKGMYFEQLSNATFDGNIFDGVGNFGRVAPPFGNASQNGEFGQAIDINLKYGTYENVTFTDTTITNSGHSDQHGEGPTGAFGAAIGVKVRDDGGYAADPASFTGEIVFDGLVIDGTSTGVRVGEPGKDNDGPSVVLTNVTITDADVADISNVTDSATGGTIVVEMADGQVGIDASPSQAGVEITGNALDNVIKGGSGDDTIDGGAGSDTLDGGAGVDTAVYVSAITAAMVSLDGEDGFVVTTGGIEGTDAITGVEVIEHGGEGAILLVGNGGFATIQEAIDAASEGDTIIIAAGDYTENLTIGKGITLVGLGDVKIMSASGVAITISGDVNGADIVLDGLSIDGGTKGVHVVQTANAGKLTIRNSDISGNTEHGVYVIGDDPDNDGSGPIVAGITAIEVIDSTFSNNGTKNNHNGAGNIKLFGFSGDALFQDVTITGADAATSQNDRPDYGIEITGYVNNGNANPVGAGAPNIGSVVFDNVVINGAFHKNGVAIANYTGLDGLVIGGANGDLDLSGVETIWGPVFNIDSVEDGIIDASNYDITFPEGPGIVAEIQGDTKNQDEVDQTITGTSSNDALMGKGGDDTLYGGDGDDTLYGADKPGNSQADDDGADTLYGGAGDDTLYGGDGNDALHGGSGQDTLDGGNGLDTAVYSDATAAVVVTLDGANDVTVYVGGAAKDTIRNIENVTGGSGDDVLTGDAGANVFVGNGGSDTIDGGGGNDTVAYAGSLVADDVAASGAGWQVDDKLGGTDTLSNIKFVQHAGGRFLLVGNGGFADINEAAAAAVQAGDTIIMAEPPAPGDPITVAVPAPTAPINLTIPYDNPISVTIEGDFDNAITTGAGDDVIVLTGSGDNFVEAGAGNDVVVGGSGNDKIVGGDGAGYDIYIGGSGDNTLIYSSAVQRIVVDLREENRSAQAVTFDPADPPYFDTIGEMIDGLSSPLNPTDIVGYAEGADIATDVFTDMLNVTAGAGDDEIHGNEGNNVIYGGADHDDVVTTNSDTIYGYGGDDELYGGTGDDALYGGDDDDTLTGGTGSDSVEGGAGDDTIVYVAGDGTDTMIDGGADDDALEIAGTEGDDTIKIVVSGAFIVKLTSNADTHGVADNVVNIESITLDLSQGGDDTLDYSGTAAGTVITVDIGAGTATGFGAGISGVNNVIGGSADDSLTGDAGANRLEGGDGDDTLVGGDGDDVIIGGAGMDYLFGGDGADTFQYLIGDGGDEMYGGDGDDTLAAKGTSGDDIIDVGYNGTELTSFDGGTLESIQTVTLDALGGTDTLSYAGGTTAVTVNLAEGSASGFASIVGVENVTGSKTGDSLTGDAGSNRLDGGAGDDALYGGSGDDTLVGGSGADTLYGGAGIDTAVYSSALGDASLTYTPTGWQVDGGAEGIDSLVGVERIRHDGVGEFLLVGAGGYANRSAAEAEKGVDDILVFAGSLSAVSDVESGPNTVAEFAATGTAVGIIAEAESTGQGGAVVYTLADDAGGRFAIDAASGVVSVANGDLIDYGVATSHQIAVMATNALGLQSTAVFEITVEEVTGIVLVGGKGDDELVGTNGADRLEGHGGNDVLYGAAGPDLLLGGKGKDKLYGGAGHDELNGGNAKDVLYGGDGDDLLIGGKGKDTLYGGAGNDTASYAASSKKVNVDLGKTKQKGGDANGDKLYEIDNVIGSRKGDKLTGNGGDNILDGGNGKDRLDGKGGNDLLIGGKGKDTFVFKAGYGADIIADFAKGDTIDLSFKGIQRFKDLAALMDDIDGDTVIDFGNGDTLTLVDTKVSSLGRADFDF